MKRLIATLALATVALAAAACGTSSAAEPAASAAPVDPNAPAVTAKDLKFTAGSVAVPAGKPFSLQFRNDDGAPHNVAIYPDASAKGALFQGEIFGGPGARAYQVPALSAGTYFFRCDVHPDMKGELVAS